MTTKFRKSRGAAFTLLELLIVLGLISVLLALLLPSLGSARVATQRAQTRARFAQWAAAMELFRQEYGHYPMLSRAGKLDPDRFAAALLGGRTPAGEPLAASATAAELAGNVRRLTFYSVESAEMTEDQTALIDGFGNRDIAVRVDWSGDGRIGPEDTAPDEVTGWPAVAGAGGGSWAPPAEAIGPGGRVPARVVFYSAGRAESVSDLVLSWK